MGKVIYDERWNQETLPNLDRILRKRQAEYITATDTPEAIYAYQGVTIFYREHIEREKGLRSIIILFGKEGDIGEVEKILLEELREAQQVTGQSAAA
ncbi:hypothetical protein HYS50_03740 [Candidatus Woesearchaeota archaeon]|nr:hypothetical protein [Candidatus Woesearchaeota archaeon]